MNARSRYGRTYSVLMIDVDYFKRYTDARGRRAGDECLQHVARCLRNSCRSTEVVGRYGGGAFVRARAGDRCRGGTRAG